VSAQPVPPQASGKPDDFAKMGYHSQNIEILERGRISIAQNYPPVEFDLGKAHTADVLFISESDIRSIRPSEVWRIRPLDTHRRDTEPAEWEHGLFDVLREDSEVALRRNFRDAGLEKGDLGAVKSCNDETGTYQVQMAVGQEWEGPLLTLRREGIRLRERDEIVTVRKFTTTYFASGDGSSQSLCT
jgi:hypothetical protein